MHIDVPAVTAADLILPTPTEGSAEVAARVVAARRLQRDRFEALGLPPATTTNAAAPAAAIEHAVTLDAGATTFIRNASETMRLTARGFHRVLKLARTLADLEASSSVRRAHLAEALSYRKTPERATTLA